MTNGKTKAFLLGIFVFSLGLGFAYFLLAPASILPSGGDAIAYDAIGWNIAQGKGFSLDGNTPTVIRGPGYPFFLAIIYWIAGHSFAAVRLVQILLHAVSCLFVYLVARESYGGKAGIAAVVLYATYPVFVFYTGFMLSETLSILLLLVSVLLLLRAMDRRSWALAGIGGIVLGVGTLCKPTTLLYPAFLAMIWALRGQTRPLAKYALVLTAAMFCTVAPWTVRNYRCCGHFVPVSVFSGYNLYLGTLPRDQLKSEINVFRDDFWTNPAQKDREAMRQGLKNIGSNPIGYVSRMPGKLAYFLVPDGMAIVGNSRTPQGIVWILFQAALFLFALAGCFREIASPKTLVFTSLIVYFALMHVVLVSSPRYNLPVMPYVLTFSGIGLMAAFDRIKRRGGAASAGGKRMDV